MITGNVLSTPINQVIKTSSTDKTGKQDFLQLLMTELRNQDPTEPIKNEDFLAQLAQFNSLEQMQNLNTTMSTFSNYLAMTQSASLIGKTITGVESKNSATITGVVQSVNVSNGTLQLEVLGTDGVVYQVVPSNLSTIS